MMLNSNLRQPTLERVLTPLEIQALLSPQDAFGQVEPARGAGLQEAADEAWKEPPYQITADKLLAPEALESLLRISEKRARMDLANGRKVWVTRYMLVHLACASGLRGKEIAELRLSDLVVHGNGHRLLVSRSRGGGRRKVDLGPKLAQHMEQYLRIREMTWGEDLTPEDLLLPGRQRTPFTTAALRFSFRKAVEAAQLPTAYSLRHARHSYSAFLLAKTNDLRYVQRQMGHANQNMTLLYRDVAPLMNMELAESLLW